MKVKFPLVGLRIWKTVIVVFLCVTVTHGDDISPVAFALDRMIDTTIGIAVALCINIKPLCPP